MKKIRCPICGTEMDDEAWTDCPYCDWTYSRIEQYLDEDELEATNPVSIRKAKELVAKGLNIWGEPLPRS